MAFSLRTGLILALIAGVALTVLVLPTASAHGQSAGEAGIALSVIDTNPYDSNGFLLSPGGNYIVRDSSGTIYVVYSPRVGASYQRNNYLRWSDDDGFTWSEAVRTEPYPDSVSAQTLAVDGEDTLHHGFTFNVGSFFTRSTDQGWSWIDPVALHDGGWGDWDYQPSVVVSDTGKLHAAYQTQFGWNVPPSNLVYKSSNDNGDTWSSRLDLTSYSYTGDYGVNLANLYQGKDGWLFATYNYLHTHDPATYDPKLMLVYFDGLTWSEPISVSTPGAVAWHGGDMAVDSAGLLHLVWSEFDPDLGYYQLRYSTFDPVIRTLSASRVLSATDENPSHVTMGIYAEDKTVIAYDLHSKDGETVTYHGIYARTSHDDFARAWRVSTHPNARFPNLRSSYAFMNQPERQDLIWVEPNPDGGESLVYADLCLALRFRVYVPLLVRSAP